MSPSSRTGTTTALGLLIARLALGAIFAAHGYQKLVTFGLAGVTDSFRGMGVPAPELVAPVVAIVELVGGIALIAGAFTGIVGLVLALDMLAAALLVHVGQGVFIENGGWELVGALGAGALALAAVGAGRFSLDGLRRGGSRGARSRSASAATASV
ncbi:DoxX family protein [Brachybacterium saurashtrense]|uniref:DoxX family protein n=1 Tax=Brachybacterium saurashtrense TaxID=556288 RepID=A0A345YSK0_9MICO|nr:DoxX family protein [Brachybacterium saurashtrense]AXK46902.1 DoxX family protein [Brachybacterium saurashtrense]RRR22617.1 DoxX family protein [Brachybacterium saurashtrense]